MPAKLVDWWNGLWRRMTPLDGAGTIASGRSLTIEELVERLPAERQEQVRRELLEAKSQPALMTATGLEVRLAILARANGLDGWKEVALWLIDHPSEFSKIVNERTRMKDGKLMISWQGGEGCVLHHNLDQLIDPTHPKPSEALRIAIAQLMEMDQRYRNASPMTLRKEYYRAKKRRWF
jgi:hypothetical protein